MILGCDVDLVVVRSDLAWIEWMNERSRCNYLDQAFLDNNHGAVPYDITMLYPDVDKQEGYDFWRQEGLYDKLEPIPNAVRGLMTWKDAGWDIVFVSSLKGNHHKSKFEFLKHYFPFMDGFIGTKEKSYARVDVLIDDRISNLNSMPENVQGFQFDTPYTQDNNVRRGDITLVSKWA